MTQSILTTDGYGVIREVQTSRAGKMYRVAGDGFYGWYSSNQIFSELDDDETTTLIPFTNEDTDDDDFTNVAPADDPHAEDGVTLPWNPEPTAEWDGQITQDPDGADIDLTPTDSTKDLDTSEDPESSTQIFGKLTYISWADKNRTQGMTESGHNVDVYHTPTSIEWSFSDANGNEAHHSSHSAPYGRGLSDGDFRNAYARIEDDAQDLPRTASLNKTAAWREYENTIDGDSMLRKAAWRDVRSKASRLFKEGDVTVQLNTGREIRAKVVGDNDTYDTQVHRKNAFGDGVTYWDCNCAWGKHAYLRQRTFIGRMCSHALATYWAMQAKKLPENKNQRIDNKTERHSLAGRGYVPYSGDDPTDYGFDPSQDYTAPPLKNAPANEGGLEDPWQDPTQNQHVRSARNADGYYEEEYVPYVRRESKAAVEGGLMVWDDDLSKAIKQIFNGQPQNPGGAPGAPDQTGTGVPAGIGSDPSQMGADPSGSPLSADPTGMGGLDPNAPVDPSQGDPNGAGVDPSMATPPYVRTTTGPTVPDPTQGVVANNYSSRTYLRHQFAEFTDGNPDDNFEEWGEPNSEDADTFNTVQDLKEENDPEEAFYDDFYGRSSAVKEADLSYHADFNDPMGMGLQTPQDPSMAAPSVTDPAPGMDLNTPAVPESQLPSVPRGSADPNTQDQTPQVTATYGDGYVVQNDSNDPHPSPFIPEAEKAFKAARPNQSYVPKVFRTAPPQNRESAFVDDDTALDWLKEADNDDSSDNSWQSDPDQAMEGHDGEEDYYDHDEDYNANEQTKNSSLEEWFMDDGNSFANIKEAENFNDDSDGIVAEFQRSAAAQSLMSRTAGRHFTYAEQDDLINEAGSASQLNNLNLANSFYEDN